MESALARQRLFPSLGGASMGNVALEVYTASRPAIPLRAWLSSGLLLALVCGLAGWMSRSRSGESLGTRVEPQGWDISFRPPTRFELLTPDLPTPAYAIAYRTPTASGAVAELVFRRIEAAQNLDADEICNLILRPHASLRFAVFAAPPTRTIEKLGSLDAVQVHYPGIPMVVRGIRLQNGFGFAVSLRFEGGPIDEPLYRSFDLACRVIDFKLSSGAGR
jgi:hypothetical protein